MTTLCVLLPVYNTQDNLQRGVIELLDVLSESAGPFELCILDDGSTDDTAEVARELAARYPQVRVLRHPVRLGLAEAIQTGLDHTDGEVILVGDEDYSLDPDDLRTLWQLRDAQRYTSRPHGTRAGNTEWMHERLGWRPRPAGARRGFQFISRQAFEQFRLGQAMEMMHRIDGPCTGATATLERRSYASRFSGVGPTAGD